MAPPVRELECPRCGHVLTNRESTCPDCGFETASLHWRLTRTAKGRYGPAQKEFETLYERLGGLPVVEQAVDLFYDKVLADDRIKHFFDGVDIDRMRTKQRDFITYACGGAVSYESEALRTAHQHLGLKVEHFVAIIEDLETTLAALGVPQELAAEVVEIAKATRDDVLSSES